MVHNDNLNKPMPEHASYEIIGVEEIARRFDVLPTWVSDHCSPDCDDPIPCIRLGKYPKFEWGSPDLEAWWQRQKAKPAPRRKRKKSPAPKRGSVSGERQNGDESP